MSNSNMSLSDKKKMLTSLVNATQKKHGGSKHALSFAGDRLEELKYTFIPTTSLNVNNALSGGFARGKSAEVSGENSSGKTSLMLETIGLDHKTNPDSIWGWYDTEGDFDWEYAESKGIDPSRLMLWEMTDIGAEQGLDTLEMLIRSNTLTGIVVNSVAGLTPAKELENEMSKQEVALQARMMSKLLRKITAISNITKTAVIFINQLRTNVGQTHGDTNVSTGGRALTFFCTQRLNLNKVKVKEADGITENEGIKIVVRIRKNRCAHDNPYKVTSFTAIYGEGIDSVREIGQLAIDTGVVEKGGSWIHYPTKLTAVTIGGVKASFGSMAKFLDEIRNNKELEEALRAELAGKSNAVSMEADEIAAIEQEEKAIKDELGDLAVDEA